MQLMMLPEEGLLFSMPRSEVFLPAAYRQAASLPDSEEYFYWIKELCIRQL